MITLIGTSMTVKTNLWGQKAYQWLPGARAGGGISCKKHVEACRSDENFLHLNCGGGYICQNANCTFNMSTLYFI